MTDKRNNEEISVDDLEQALLDRANALSKEYSERARRSHDHYIEDENERLRLREEREEMAAKMQAEQVYRRLVQTQELQSIKRLDQLRWQLMNQVIDDVRKELLTLTCQSERYLDVIIKMLREAIVLTPDINLSCEFNSQDYSWLKPQWQAILPRLDTDKVLTLSERDRPCIGGFVLYDSTRKIRVDNTFEGLLEKNSEEINQIVAENLFAELIPIRANINER